MLWREKWFWCVWIETIILSLCYNYSFVGAYLESFMKTSCFLKISHIAVTAAFGGVGAIEQVGSLHIYNYF